MRSLQLTGLIALGVVASGAAFVLRPSVVRPKPAAAAAHPDVPALQRLAVTSCRCERSHPGKPVGDACWKAFNAAARPWRGEGDEGFMMCGDPTEHSIELRTGETVVTRYVSSRSALFCTKEEATTAQAAYDAAERLHERDARAPTGEEVLDRLAAEFARGDKPLLVSKERGCTSG